MAPNSPACSLIQASMAGARSTAPLNRSNSVLIVATLESAGGVLSWRFERYLLVSGSPTFLILHGIAETFGLDAELAKSVQGHQSAMRVECHDMGEDAAEREGLSGFAQSVDERIIPGGAVPDVTENTMQFGIGLFEPLQHRLRGALRFGGPFLSISAPDSAAVQTSFVKTMFSNSCLRVLFDSRQGSSSTTVVSGRSNCSSVKVPAYSNKRRVCQESLPAKRSNKSMSLPPFVEEPRAKK